MDLNYFSHSIGHSIILLTKMVLSRDFFFSVARCDLVNRFTIYQLKQSRSVTQRHWLAFSEEQKKKKQNKIIKV